MIEDLLHYRTDINIAAGKLLISEPLLLDESFNKSVIFMCHHDAKESVGYVLNRYANDDLSNYIPDMNGINFPLHRGGPVGLDSLHILHTVPELIGGEHIQEGIYWGGELESAVEQIKLGRITETNCKFFLGYSGWGEGQLDAELDMQSWLVSNASIALVFETANEYVWKQSIANLGNKFNPLLYVPQRPELN